MSYKFWGEAITELIGFPSPFEVTGVSYKLHKFYDFIIIEFPSPLEVTGGSNVMKMSTLSNLGQFPSPLEVTGVSYTIFNDIIEIVFDISVPSRGDWGFLPEVAAYHRNRERRFPSPLEETGGSY